MIHDDDEIIRFFAVKSNDVMFSICFQSHGTSDRRSAFRKCNDAQRFVNSREFSFFRYASRLPFYEFVFELAILFEGYIPLEDVVEAVSVVESSPVDFFLIDFDENSTQEDAPEAVAVV